MRALKIAVFMPTISGGGSERFAVLLSNGLAEKGNETTLITRNQQENEYELSPKVHRMILNFGSSLILNAWIFHRYIHRYSPDACIAVGLYPNWVAALANINLKTKIILTERSSPKEDSISWKSRLLRKILYRSGDAYVFQTPNARDFYCRTIRKRSIVIPNPIIEGLPMRSTDPKKEIVAVGRLEMPKNYPMLLEAFKIVNNRFPDYKLLIYGKGTYEDMLLAKVADLGLLEQVKFEGFRRNVHQCIKNSDIFVMTSDFEGMPNALMEAMAMGFPVVATDCPCGGPRMLIKDGVNGLLCPVNNSKVFAERIISLLLDSNLKKQCADNAKESMSCYSLDAIMNRWQSFLESSIEAI